MEKISLIIFGIIAVGFLAIDVALLIAYIKEEEEISSLYKDANMVFVSNKKFSEMIEVVKNLRIEIAKYDNNLMELKKELKSQQIRIEKLEFQYQKKFEERL